MGTLSPHPAPPRLRSWVALGDSLTAGHVEGEPTWVDALRRQWSRGEGELSVFNLAVAGARAPDVARDQVPAALALDPDLVTVFCGGNDVLLDVRPDIPAFAEAYDGLAARLRSGLPGARILVATYPELAAMLPLRERARGRVARGFVAINAVIRGVARRRGLALLDFARIVEHRDRSIFAEDGVHPSPGGHRIAAEAFSDAIETLLAEQRGER